MVGLRDGIILEVRSKYLLESLVYLDMSRKRVAYDVFEDILNRYSCLGRFYHSFWHIQSMIEFLEKKIDYLFENKNLFILAMAEHDIVYFPGFPKNEELSVSVAEGHCRLLNLSKEETQYVSDLIMATKHTSNKKIILQDQKLMHDLDMCVLASPRTTFAAYEKGIKAEALYAGMSEERYQKKRNEFFLKYALSDFKGIFLLDDFKSKYLPKAIENITTYLDEHSPKWF